MQAHVASDSRISVILLTLSGELLWLGEWAEVPNPVSNTRTIGEKKLPFPGSAELASIRFPGQRIAPILSPGRRRPSETPK
jgi:hypothetical protein